MSPKLLETDSCASPEQLSFGQKFLRLLKEVYEFRVTQLDPGDDILTIWCRSASELQISNETVKK